MTLVLAFLPALFFLGGKGKGAVHKMHYVGIAYCAKQVIKCEGTN
jgi:hypothetical protein